MHFCTTQSCPLRAVFDVCGRLVLEGRITFTAEGVRMNLPTHTMYISMFLPAGKVDQYIFKHDGPLHADVNFKQIYEKMKCATQDDILTFQLTKSCLAKNTLLLHLQRPDHIQMSWELGTLSMNCEYVEPVLIGFNNVVSMDSANFQTLVRALHMQNESMQLLCSRDPTNLFMIAKGIDATCAITVPCKSAPSEPPAVATDKEYRFMVDTIRADRLACDKRELYSTDIMVHVAQAVNCGKTVEIFLGIDMPLVLRYPVGTLGSVMFCVTPRVEEGCVTLADMVDGLITDKPLHMAAPADKQTKTSSLKKHGTKRVKQTADV